MHRQTRFHGIHYILCGFLYALDTCSYSQYAMTGNKQACKARHIRYAGGFPCSRVGGANTGRSRAGDQQEDGRIRPPHPYTHHQQSSYAYLVIKMRPYCITMPSIKVNWFPGIMETWLWCGSPASFGFELVMLGGFLHSTVSCRATCN